MEAGNSENYGSLKSTVTATDALGTHKRLEPVKVAGKLNIPGRPSRVFL